MKRFFLFLLATVLGSIFAPSLMLTNAQTEEESVAVNPDQCLRGYTTVFDQVDEIFTSRTDPILTDPAIVDPALLFSSAIGTYECQLSIVCGFVESQVTTGTYEKWKKTTMEICGDTISGADGGEKELNVENAMEIFEMDDQSLVGCTLLEPREAKLNIIAQCRQFAKVKMRIQSAKLASKMKESVRDKQIGYISQKLQEIHTRMNGFQEEFPLTELTRKFSATFKSVLQKVSCTIPKTTTR